MIRFVYVFIAILFLCRCASSPVEQVNNETDVKGIAGQKPEELENSTTKTMDRTASFLQWHIRVRALKLRAIVTYINKSVVGRKSRVYWQQDVLGRASGTVFTMNSPPAFSVLRTNENAAIGTPSWSVAYLGNASEIKKLSAIIPTGYLDWDPLSFTIWQEDEHSVLGWSEDGKKIQATYNLEGILEYITLTSDGLICTYSEFRMVSGVYFPYAYRVRDSNKTGMDWVVYHAEVDAPSSFMDYDIVLPANVAQYNISTINVAQRNAWLDEAK